MAEQQKFIDRRQTAADPSPWHGVRWPDPDAGPWFITGRWVEVDGRPECIGLSMWKGVEPVPLDAGYTAIDSTKPLEGISGTDLKQIPVTTVISQLWQKQREYETFAAEWTKERLNAIGAGESEPWDEHEVPTLTAYVEEPESRPFTQMAKPKRRKIDDRQWFADVARVYAEAYLNHQYPTQAVAEHFHVAPSTAAKWVGRARVLGFLDKTSKGRPGGVPKKKGH